MTSTLRASTLATAAATILAFGSPAGAFADGRGDWTGYAWQKIEIAKCATEGSTIACPLYHQKWDWKRNQWVDIAIGIDASAAELTLTQRLTDNDPGDSDYVCVTVLAVDAAGRDIVAHHQNWQIGPGDVMEDSFRYEASALGQIATIFLGSKQCRDGAGQDDDTYARVLAGLSD